MESKESGGDRLGSRAHPSGLLLHTRARHTVSSHLLDTRAHTVMMPAGAADSRGAQKSALSGVIHDKRTDKEMGALLGELQKEVR
jgi:hypothetical protein